MTGARTDITITATKDRPAGTVVLRGARIITMKGDEVIPRGDVVVTNNRITAVGAEGSVTVPAGARTIDVSGPQFSRVIVCCMRGGSVIVATPNIKLPGDTAVPSIRIVSDTAVVNGALGASTFHTRLPSWRPLAVLVGITPTVALSPARSGAPASG